MFTNSLSPVNDSVVIPGTTVSKYLDTASWDYKLCPPSRDYYIQNVNNDTLFQYFAHDSSKTAAWLRYRDNQLIEYCSFWYNDSIKCKVNFNRGLITGKHVGFYDNGNIEMEYFYDASGTHRKFNFYYYNGSKQRACEELEIENDKYRLWKNTDYYRSGNIKQSGLTRNGYKIGKWEYYSKDGKSITEKKHKGKEWLGPPEE